MVQKLSKLKVNINSVPRLTMSPEYQKKQTQTLKGVPTKSGHTELPLMKPGLRWAQNSK